MSEFYLWFSTGVTHILDWNAYDHLLFIVALTVPYSFKEYKKVFWLATAFTLGHSLTLALSATNVIQPSAKLIELLIPITILVSCVSNVYSANKKTSFHKTSYLFATLFGLIHGMGFSFLLKSLLGKQESIGFPLLSFNLGLELGQLIIIGTLLSISLLLKPLIKRNETGFNIVISLFVFLVAICLIITRIKQL